MCDRERRMSQFTIGGTVGTLLRGVTEGSGYAAGINDLYSAFGDRLFKPADVLQLAYGLILSASTDRLPYKSNRSLLEEYSRGVSMLAFMLCRVNEDIELLMNFKNGLARLNLPFLVSLRSI